MTEAERLAQALERYCTDWDGSQMDDHTEPMPGLHCIELRHAAAELRRLSADARMLDWLEADKGASQLRATASPGGHAARCNRSSNGK